MRGSSTTILPCRAGHGSGRHRPTSWGPACRFPANTVSFGRLGPTNSGMAAATSRGCGGLPRSPIANVDRDAAERRHLDAVKVAGHLGVTGSPVGACLELAADAHLETALRAAAGDRRARCRQRTATRSRPSTRRLLRDTFYWRCGASRHAARGRAIATYQLDDHQQHHWRYAVESAWGAVSALPPVRFPGRAPNPACASLRTWALHGRCRQALLAQAKGGSC